MTNQDTMGSEGPMQKNCSWFPSGPSRAVDVGRLARLMGRSVTRRARAHEINTNLFYLERERQLPMAHTPDVDVHEVRAAIVPYSSAMQAQGCVTQLRRRN